MNHFRVSGQITGWGGGSLSTVQGTGYLRARGPGRVVYGHLVPYGVSALIEPAKGEPFREHFARGSVRMPAGPRPGFWLEHRSLGGTRVGSVVAVLSQPAWCDVACAVDEGEAGDAVLDTLGADGGRVPLSIGFRADPGGTVRYHGGPVVELERTRVTLTEVAMTEAGAYEGAYCYAVGTLSSLAELQATD